MDEWVVEFGHERPSGMGSLMREVVDGRMGSTLSANQRAALLWARANGDRERAHTTGVFLRRARVSGADPILGVFVDSHAMAVDFGVNKELYLARLANVGLAVSGIEFRVSREGYRGGSAVRSDKQAQDTAPLPELGADERQEVEELVAELPESLRAAARKAVERSKRREKRDAGGSAS